MHAYARNELSYRAFITYVFSSITIVPSSVISPYENKYPSRVSVSDSITRRDVTREKNKCSELNANPRNNMTESETLGNRIAADGSGTEYFMLLR
jgi:hypothetical protein